MVKDYEKPIYNFICSQIRGLKWIYGRDFASIKDTGIKHYGLVGYSDADWDQAWNWAIADEFNGGCEIEKD